jgi:diketogulonate reductase-like aldo/keto reductase
MHLDTDDFASNTNKNHASNRRHKPMSASFIAYPRSRTTNLDRIVENLIVFDFELGEDEMAAIQALARPNRRIVKPVGLAPVWDAS